MTQEGPGHLRNGAKAQAGRRESEKKQVSKGHKHGGTHRV